MKLGSCSRFAFATVAAVTLLGCGGGAERTGPAAARPLEVVAAFYPLAWAATVVGGDAVEVSDLTPAGAEPHELELRPSQVVRIIDADLVIVMGAGFQPSVEAVVAERQGATLSVFDALDVGRDPERGADPHVWLDVEQMGAIVDAISRALGDAAPDRRATFDHNADVVGAALNTLDREYAAALSSCAHRELITSHDAFGWLADRYGLITVPIAGVSPDAEPSAERLAELTALVAEYDATTIFAEVIVSPAIAETLASEVGGVSVAILDPIEGRSDTEIDAGHDYVDLMRANLAVLRDGLGCS